MFIPELRWAELMRAPATLDLDGLQARLTHVIDEFVAGGLRDSGPEGVRRRLQRVIERFVVHELGLWANHWTWTASEPGGGGPVHGYCCASHSLLQDKDRSSSESAARVVRALENLRQFIFWLRAQFANLRSEHGDNDFAHELELVAAALLPLIIQRTQAEDAWYATFSRVLVWYVEFSGRDPLDASNVISETVSGNFKSWIEPTPETAAQTCHQLAALGAGALSNPAPPIDGLDTWRRARPSTSIHWAPHESRIAGQDGHLSYIEKVDRPRDAARANRMLLALERARSLARANEPLTLARLTELQALVLGLAPSEIPFRTTRAYAKGGREFYSVDVSTQGRFERCLSEANDISLPTSLRAARVYLDIAFFHPFQDGNARAARLALDWVLTRDSLVLSVPDVVFKLSRRADEPQLGYRLAWLVEEASGPVADATAAP